MNIFVFNHLKNSTSKRMFLYLSIENLRIVSSKTVSKGVRNMWFLKRFLKLIKRITKRVSFELLYMFRGLFTSLFNFLRMYFMGTFIASIIFGVPFFISVLILGVALIFSLISWYYDILLMKLQPDNMELTLLD
jgi:hypothetical protein